MLEQEDRREPRDGGRCVRKRVSGYDGSLMLKQNMNKTFYEEKTSDYEVTMYILAISEMIREAKLSKLTMLPGSCSDATESDRP